MNDPNDQYRYAYDYALAKQLQTAYSIETNYGSITLDPEMREAVDAALRPIIERRLAEQESKNITLAGYRRLE